MKLFYFRLMLPLIPLLAFLILFSRFVSGKDNISLTEPYVRLATLWDAQGVIQAISPDGSLLVINDNSTGILRLVEIRTGNVRGQWSSQYVTFSPDGQYLLVQRYEPRTTIVVETATGNTIADFSDGFGKFSRDSRLLLISFYDRETNSATSKVMEVATGNILGEFSGSGDEISPDNNLITLVDPQSLAASVVEISTGTVLLEVPALDYVDGVTSINTAFTRDGASLAVYHLHTNTNYIYDTATWTLRFQVKGGIWFNRDSRFLIADENDDLSQVQLVDIATGEVLDEMQGEMSFSSDGQYLFRAESVTYEIRNVQIIDLITNEIVAEQTGWMTLDLRANNTILERFDVTDQTTRYIDIATGNVLRQFAGEATMSDHSSNVVLIHDSPQRLIGFESEDVYVTDSDIRISTTDGYAFASNGLLVDIYGPQSSRYITMPSPRPDGGIARVEAGELEVYSAPSSQNPTIENIPRQQLLYIIGQTDQHDWLYITHIFYDFNVSKRVEGWIRAENLTVIEPWDDAPVLDPADPLGSLRTIAEANAS